MTQSETVERILDAAEVLFAERGFSETSLRQITSRAGVNLAAVNYHFGSKNALIQAVFARFIEPFTRNLRESLEATIANHETVSLDKLLRLLATALVEVPSNTDNDSDQREGRESSLPVFMRLLGLAYTQSQGHLRKYLEHRYNAELRLFMRLLRLATPQLSSVERFWRMQFMLGALTFTMSSSESLASILVDKDGATAPAESIVDQLVPFLSAGINAPAILPVSLSAVEPSCSIS